MNRLQKLLSHFWEIRLKEFDSAYNGKLFVNLEYGRKVLHTKTANYSFQNLHKVLKFSLESIAHKISTNARVLNLGLGGGSSIEILREDLKIQGKVISIEHDPVIVDIAKDEFDIERFANHDIKIKDALTYLEDYEGEKFDLIICDLFKDTLVPDKFKTASFFDLLLRNLNREGSLVFNFVKRTEQDPFFMKFLNDLGDDIEFNLLNPVNENHVLILHKD